MIRAFAIDGKRLKPVERPPADFSGIAWVDLLEPTAGEEKAVEGWIGAAIPDRGEMEAIEISSRLYSHGGIHFMTATLPAHSDSDHPTLSPVTFVLAGEKLVTVRYHEPAAFRTFPEQARDTGLESTGGAGILIGLLDAIVEHTADLLEELNKQVIELSHTVFRPNERNAQKRGRTFQLILRGIGRKEGMIAGLQESLVTLQRLTGYLIHISQAWKDSGVPRERMKTIARDMKSLIDHAETLSQKIYFLLDATLGMISIEQNGIMQIVSVATVVFLPPTLVASTYGMNFRIMPELQWHYGYAFALLLMVAAAVIPFWYFKRKGWF